MIHCSQEPISAATEAEENIHTGKKKKKKVHEAIMILRRREETFILSGKEYWGWNRKVRH